MSEASGAQARRWLAVAVLALGAAWLVSPTVVPIYDGLSFPQDPYRYVGASPPPEAAHATLTLTGGVNRGGAVLNTPERGPQVQLYVPPGALRAASPTVEVTVTPVEMAGSTTADQPVSNVYRFAGGASTALASGRAPIQVTLRAAEHKSPPVMYYRSGPTDRWERLPTRGLGHASFNATAPGFGDYVLVRGAAAAAAGERVVLGIVGLLGVSIVASLLTALRRRKAAEARGR